MSERKRGLFRRGDKDVAATADSAPEQPNPGRKARRSTADMFAKQQAFDDPWSSDAWAEDWNDEWNDPGRRASIRPAAAPRSADVDAWLNSDQGEFADVTADMARKWAPNAEIDSGPGSTWDELDEAHEGYDVTPEQAPSTARQQNYEAESDDLSYEPQQTQQFEGEYEPQQYEPQQYEPQQYEPQQYEPQQYEPQQYEPQQYEQIVEQPVLAAQHDPVEVPIVSPAIAAAEVVEPVVVEPVLESVGQPQQRMEPPVQAEAPVSTPPTGNSLDDGWDDDWDWDDEPSESLGASSTTTNASTTAVGDGWDDDGWDDEGDMDRSVESDLFDEFDDEKPSSVDQIASTTAASTPVASTAVASTPAVNTTVDDHAAPLDGPLDRVVESRHDSFVADTKPTNATTINTPTTDTATDTTTAEDDDLWDDLDDSNLGAAAQLDAQLDDTAEYTDAPQPTFNHTDVDDSPSDEFDDDFKDDFDDNVNDDFGHDQRNDGALVGAGVGPAALATAATNRDLDAPTAPGSLVDVAPERVGLAKVMLNGGLGLAAVSVIRMITSIIATLRSSGSTTTEKLAAASSVMGSPVALALVVAAALALLGRYLAGSGSRVGRSLGNVCGVVSAAGGVVFILAVVALVKALDGANTETTFRALAEFAGTGLVGLVALLTAWRASSDKL